MHSSYLITCVKKRVLQFVFAGARPGDELHFTTEVNVLPNNLPYDACLSPEECYGKLKWLIDWLDKKL